MQETTQTIISYHERTKHHPHRYAQSLGFLDWDNQPNPFRSYPGAIEVALSLNGVASKTSYEQMLSRSKIQPAKLNLESLSKFLEFSLALSAWKSIQHSKWSLRINPSSGNLHPTEAHLILPPGVIAKDKAALCHYNPLKHCLEVRKQAGFKEIANLSENEGMSFLICLTSIYWREAWKYGERAFRYCNHDLGHALACLSFAGSLLGWKVEFEPTHTTSQIEQLFCLEDVDWVEGEKEEVEALLKVTPHSQNHLMESWNCLTFNFKPDSDQREQVNPLSDAIYPWSVIEEVSEATRKTAAELSEVQWFNQALNWSFDDLNAEQIILQRRSAVAFDGKTFMSKDVFFSMLDRTLPRVDHTPFDLNLGLQRVNLLLFVHRVTGLEPGLYFLLRNGGHLQELKSLAHLQLEWVKVDTGCNLPLFRLLPADLKMEATLLSCQQDIAGMSCFSLGMIARFRDELNLKPWIYRQLYWETGMIGQVLYLEAEAHGLRGTGIGCFFDDLAHQILGLSGNEYQSLYHFTVGMPVEDQRLTQLEAYHHLKCSDEVEKL